MDGVRETPSLAAGPSASTWAEECVRRFRFLLYAVSVLFIATECLAMSGLVAVLRPLSLPEITGDLHFAIGFGCPLVLHWSSLPGWREIAVTLVIGIVLGLLIGAVQTVGASQMVVGLGMASLGMLGSRAWRETGRTRLYALQFLLPACVSLLFTLEAGIHFQLISSVLPFTFDEAVCAIDGAFGVQLSFAAGRLFAAAPVFAGVCAAIYFAPPPSLVFVYALQVRARRPPPVDVVTVLLVSAVVGYCLYFVYPVAGPLVAFPDHYPNAEPTFGENTGYRMFVPFAQPNGAPAPRNGMPSLHFASALLAYWHVRPYGWWARGVAAVFVVGTFLATLGLGEHYFLDLVVALPFTLFIQAACTPGRPPLRVAKRNALLGSGVLLAIWYGLLFGGVGTLQWSPVLPWGLTLITTALVWRLEFRLYRAAHDSSGDRGESLSHKTAPGPRGTLLGGNLADFRGDVLKLLMDGHRDFGDIVRFRLGPLIVHSVAHPDQIKHVLVTNQHNYNKDTRSSSKIRSFTGDGLLTSSGDFWLDQRRLMQPAFQAQRLAAFTSLMTDATEAMLHRWQRVPTNEPIDVASEMMRLTFTIVGGALFGADVAGDLEIVERAAAIVMEHSYRRLERVIDVPLWIPTPANRRFHRAVAEIDRVVLGILERQWQASDETQNLVSLLLRRRDQLDLGDGMSETQLRNETITLLLAGHETTANALTWAFHLLAKHPHAAARIRAEAADVLGDRVPTAADLPRLTYTTMAFQEAMRLYPSIWIMERNVLAADTISGYQIPAGSSVVICPYVTHRHPHFWDRPEEFDPERFTPANAAGRVPLSYIPFGGGQRLCIGKDLAMMEAQVILPMALRALHMKHAPGTVVEPNPGITLRTKFGLPMIVTNAHSQ